MKKMSKMAGLLAGAILVLILCVGSVHADEKETGAEKVATVNGVVITQAAFEREFSKVQKQAAMQGQQIPADRLAQLKSEIVDNLINEELLFQESQRQGIKVTPDTVESSFAAIKQNFPDDAAFKKALAELDLSETELQSKIERGQAAKQLIDAQVANGISVSDDENKAFYDAHPEYFKKPEQVKASHILIKPEAVAETTGEDKAAAEKAAKDKALVKIKEVQTKLAAGGDFSALAKEYSACPSSSKGGDLGFFSRGRMVKAFEDAAFAMEPGQVSEIVETSFGYHLIKVTEKQPAAVVSHSEAKEKIGGYLKQEKMRKEVGAYVDGLRSNAVIEK